MLTVIRKASGVGLGIGMVGWTYFQNQLNHLHQPALKCALDALKTQDVFSIFNFVDTFRRPYKMLENVGSCRETMEAHKAPFNQMTEHCERLIIVTGFILIISTTILYCSQQKRKKSEKSRFANIILGTFSTSVFPFSHRVPVFPDLFKRIADLFLKSVEETSRILKSNP